MTRPIRPHPHKEVGHVPGDSRRQDLSQKFKDAAGSGNSFAAFAALQGLNLLDALVSCLELAESNRSAFDTLAGAATTKERPQFSVRLVKDGAIPSEPFNGIGADNDYHVARVFILQARVEKKRLMGTLWPSAESVASSRLFYPDKVRAVGDRRERVCIIARADVGKGPGMEEQVALFSLGGLYNYAVAKGGTRPAGTTCILTARSVLHASGCNMIGAKTSHGYCGVPSGLFAEFPKDVYGYVDASQYDSGVRPKKGDIFHIRGDNFKDKDGNDTGHDSTHVGIIVNVRADDVWETVEGGASDHVTRSNTRTLISVNSRHGKWAFKGDSTSAGVRPVQGWYSIERIQGRWMTGA
jgi:hypothetical protein